MGYSSSVVVDTRDLSIKLGGSDFFGEHSEALRIGGNDLLEPTYVKVIGVHEVGVRHRKKKLELLACVFG